MLTAGKMYDLLLTVFDDEPSFQKDGRYWRRHVGVIYEDRVHEFFVFKQVRPPSEAGGKLTQPEPRRIWLRIADVAEIAEHA